MYFLFNSFLANIFFLYPWKTPQKISFIFSGSYRKGRFVWNTYISKYSKYSKVTLEYKNGLGRPYHFKIFKGCLPQILLGPFLNTMTHFSLCISSLTYLYYLHTWKFIVCPFSVFSLNIISDKRVHNVAVNSCKPFHSRTRRGMSTQLDEDLVDFQFWSHITCCQ